MISQDQMMRELHLYAMEEMRNRGLEEAAEILIRYCYANPARPKWDISCAAAIELIREAKRDPAAQMSDWWERPPQYNWVPIGA